MSTRFHQVRWLVPLLALLALSALPTVAQDRHEAERAYQDLQRSVVRIEVRYPSIFAPPGAGSGVVIGNGLIATADHVIDGALEVSVVHPGDDRQPAEIIRRSPGHDLALIRIERAEALVPIERHDRPVRPGQCVLALGNVMNSGVGIFGGIVSLASDQPHPPEAGGGILTDITTPPGLSGGALVECDGQTLVGIISFGVLALTSAAPTAGIVGAVPVSRIEDLMALEVACSSARHTQC
jgi:putative serine protease PepD